MLVGGKFVKRDGRIVTKDYANIREQFLEGARNIQKKWLEMPYPTAEGAWMRGYAYGLSRMADVVRREGLGMVSSG